MGREDGGYGSEVAQGSATFHRRGWLHLAVTVGVAILIVTGGWIGMVYLLETSNAVTYVKGTSMLPVLRDGDLIFLRGTTAQEIARDFQAGDRDIILVFWSSVYQTDTIHRVIAVEYDSEGNIIGFRTQGDNNPGPDFGIAKEQDIIGRVVYHISYLGYLPIFFGSTTGRVISGAIIVLLVIWTVVDERKRRMGQAQHADKAPSLELYIGVYIDVPGRL